MKTCIYLDNAATTFPKPQPVIDAVNYAMQNLSVNAGRGSYSLAKKASEIIEECRHNIRSLAGLSEEYGVILTPSATIAMNQIVFGIETSNHSNIYVSPFEHNSVLRPVHELCSRLGCTMHVLPFDRETWALDVVSCKSMFAAYPPTAVFSTLISNVTGYQLPIQEISELTHEFSGICIVDASQALGAIDFNYRTANADAYIFAGHKTLYGPFGIGGMLVKQSIMKKPLIYGGTGSDSLNLNMPDEWQTRNEAGSYNIIAIAGLNAGVTWISSTKISEIYMHEKKMMNKLIDSFRQNTFVQMYLPQNLDTHNGILAFNIDKYDCSDIAGILSEDFNICVRAGYHCAGLTEKLIDFGSSKGCLRAGLSHFTCESDIDALINAIITI